MKPNTFYVISDSVGETAELLVKAAISQFTIDDSKIQRIPYVNDEQTMVEAFEQAEANEGLIAFTLVKPEFRQKMFELSDRFNVPTVDVLGPLLDKLEGHLEEKPKMEPGLVHKLDEDYYKRVEAIEFAVKYDDGRDAKGILKADLVLIGVSRTSKTPLSQFLAHKRIKVANVPIVPEVEPPEELYQVDPGKCIGLKINSDKLTHIRTERLKALGLDGSANYAKADRIQEEIDYFNRVVDKIGCRTIDVSNKAVEETANVIRHMIKK
ncbi:phosphoenolpyruvate synthase regulatory protein [Halalkalibacillus sediminis]|uniref:Putative pyruvate, phosphate dikinase regulatory protein n=1 Tax=Halalkalibacillus sediminis TaxID=2018042 RepID=A0A2I0QXI0_9BACI|nr:pyruvate, water dikinase regulatory protein [Halalkalibacillus sediminis]PKR79019.1 phosphoenolpyruvate synthase regulatory protein [Halalkalibacillus sediminis]